MIKKLLYLLLFFYCLVSAGQQKKAMLNLYKFEEIEELQKQQEKPVLIFIHTDWCNYCLAMKANTFSDLEVVKKINDSYYFLMLNAESKEDIVFYNRTFKHKPTGNDTGVHELAELLSEKEGQVLFPSTVILNSKRNIDVQYNTFLSSDEMLNILSSYLRVTPD